MEPLTDKQRKVLNFIEARLKDNAPPSQREIAHYFGLAQNSVYQLVGYLKRKDYLVDTGSHRGLRLSKEYLAECKQIEGIPIVGRVAAGEPTLAEQNIEGYANLNEMFGRSKDVFLLRVVGDSMIDEGIMPGDLVAVESGAAIENGQIGVVLLDDEATVKRVFFRRGRIALKPANRTAGYKTKYITRSSPTTRIIGKVIGCLRNLQVQR